MMKKSLLACLAIVCGLGCSTYRSYSQELTDAEINRLFDATIHPDSPGAPLQIEMVNRKRQEAVGQLYSQLFSGTGPQADMLEIFEDGILTRHELPVKNVQVVLPGLHADKLIVLGAHLDQVPKRPEHLTAPQGVIDDWSGVAMLIKLYEDMRVHAQQHGPFHHTFVFVAFGYEESGLWGSETYVQQLVGKNRVTDVKAMVNFECLGVSDLFTWDNGSTEWLEELAVTVAGDLDGVSLQRRMLTGVGADSVPFSLAHRPAITIDSLSSSDFGKIHTPDDNRQNINSDQFRKAFRFGKAYLRRLDSTLAIAPQLADNHATLPVAFASFSSANPLRHLSWEPTAASVVPMSSFAAMPPRGETYELQFLGAIEKANASWIANAKTGNANELAKLYSSNAVIIPPDGDPANGREAIKDYYANLFAEIGGGIETQFTSTSLRLGRDVAYERGVYSDEKPIRSHVVWKPVEKAGEFHAEMHFDAWYHGSSTGETSNAFAPDPRPQGDAADVGVQQPCAIRLSENIYAIRDGEHWCIFTLKDGKPQRIPLENISEPKPQGVSP